MKKRLINIRNVEYIYNAGTPIECTALTGVNFELYSGEIVSLIGHTGSGKSTLVQLLNGQRRPTSGAVEWENLDVFTGGKLDGRKLCTRIGMVFQYPEDQVFEETVYDDIAFGPRQLGKNPSETESIVFAAAESLELKRNLLMKSPFELSGGTLRKVAIAGVLAMEPAALVLDEPMAGLDPHSCDNFAGILRGLRRNLGIAIVMVSHNLEYVAEVSDRIYCMKNGKIELDGAARDVFSSVEKLAELNVGCIPASYMAHKLAAAGFSFGTPPVCMDELVKGIVENYDK